MFELWEVNNTAFSDSLKQQDDAACVTFCDRAYLCLKGWLLMAHFHCPVWVSGPVCVIIVE